MFLPKAWETLSQEGIMVLPRRNNSFFFEQNGGKSMFVNGIFLHTSGFFAGKPVSSEKGMRFEPEMIGATAKKCEEKTDFLAFTLKCSIFAQFGMIRI
ncbi:MAG: hypothetical protein J6Y84_07785 [Bacteroidaceae bacterium]|nr:hypothetical protein [Bacteroidaceae bacterium]